LPLGERENARRQSISVPLLEYLSPGGFFYGGHYIVEFDPDSIWYETSLTMAALALKQGMKTEYHVFQHPPSEAVEAFRRLGLDAKKLEKEGLLSIWDSYTETLEYETEKKAKQLEDLASRNLWTSTRTKPLDMAKSAKRWAERIKAGFPEEEKRWFHVDDNTAIFLQYNDEKDFVDIWRTGALPAIRARESPHFLAFVKGVASESFYTKFEAECDGIIDVKAQEEGGRIENYLRVRTLRGKRFDSRWHRIELGDNGEVVLEVARPEDPRRLAAIMFTDIVGYTSMTQDDESRTMDLLKRHREILRPIIIKHGGSEVKTMGDAFLVEFSSALAAIECAADIGKELNQYNRKTGENLRLKIGIHVGDVIHEGGDIYGDAVNIASRIEPLAQGGGTCISQQVYDQVRNKSTLRFSKLEPKELKNIALPIDVYRLEAQ
jgi:class 3 adenylate cyclase